MALEYENQSTSAHLTGLSFDISEIPQQLSQIQQEVLDTAQNIANDEKYKLKLQVGSESATQEITQQTKEVQNLSQATKNLVDYQTKFKEVNGNQVWESSKIKEYNSDLSTVTKETKTLADGTTEYTQTFVDGATKRQQAQEKETAALKKQKTQFYSKQANLSDEWIAQQEKESKIFAAQIKQQMEEAVKLEQAQEKERLATEKAVEKEIANLDKLIKKYKDLISAVSAKPTSTTNANVITNATQQLSEIEKFKDTLNADNFNAQGTTQFVSDYTTQIDDLTRASKAANDGTNNLLKTITDKARWLSAFYLVEGLKDAFFGTIDVIKDTEDAVVELLRVLEEDLSEATISDELYQIAQEYGRSFEEVSETAVKFAQTGESFNNVLKQTEATMLAVNTAELEVNTATTGLIAVMKQFQIDASDMESVIDKINITADNFAVTSENIVSALQRAGSNATNANLSLEETIGLITALSEATGRSGENIGTALSSLLIYTSKAEALSTFAEIGGESVDAAVKAYQMGAGSIVDVWTALSGDLATLTKEQQDLLYQGIGGDEFAEDLEANASEITDDIKAIYGTAGTYRQNYFTALLTDVSAVQNSIALMGEAEGYSLSENEKSMATLTRQWETLKETAKELAVEFGEGGFLDDLKVMTSLATDALKLTSSLGGIETVLLLIGTAVTVLKKDKLSDVFLSTITATTTAKANITAYGVSLQDLTIKQKLAKVSGDALSVTFKTLGIGGTIGLAVTAFSMLNGKMDEHNAKVKENIQTNLENASAINEQTSSIITLVQEYERLNSMNLSAQSQKEILEIQQEILSLTEQTNAAEQDKNNTLKDQIDYYKQIAFEQIADPKNITDLTAAVTIATEEANRAVGGLEYLFDIAGAFEYGRSYTWFAELSGALQQVGADSQVLAKDWTTLEGIISSYEDILQTLVEGGSENADVIAKLQEEIQKYNAVASDQQAATDALAEGFFAMYISQQGTTELTAEQIEAYKDLQNTLYETGEIKLQQRDANIAYADSYYKVLNGLSETAVVTEGYIYDLEQLKETTESLGTGLSDYQSAMTEINSIIADYNETGGYTAEIIQRIMALNGEYANVLNVSANGLSINQSASDDLAQSQNELLASYVKNQAAVQILEYADSLLEQQQRNNEAATDDSKQAFAELAQSLGITSSAYWNLINASNEYGKSSGLNLENQAKLESYTKDVLANAQTTLDQINGLGSNSTFWGNATAGVEQVSSAQSSANNAQKEAIQQQIDLIKERYNAEIEALRAVEEENDRIRAKEEYERNRQESLRDLAQAEARSGVEYREQEYDIEQDISNADREWQEQLEDWAIEDKIAALEAERDAAVAVLQAQLDALNSVVSGTASNMVSANSQAATDSYDVYNRNFIEPSSQKTIQTYDDLVNSVYDTSWKAASDISQLYGESLIKPTQVGFENIFGPDMILLANAQAQSMYSVYSANFVAPLQQDLENIFAMAGNISMGNSARTSSGSLGGNAANYNNTSNVNMFANVQSSAQFAGLATQITTLYNRNPF